MNENDNPYANPNAAGYGNSGVMQGKMSMQSAGQQQQTATPNVPAGGVKDITSQSFMTDVIEASKTAPVVVDFWAPWCGPCKQLGPIIEKVASQTKGVTLCKMDVEQYPDVSQQMGIQSIPAVVAFVNGRPADAFMGAKSESEVRAFFDKLSSHVPLDENEAAIEAAMEQAAELAENGQHEAAAEIYASVLARESGNLDAFTGLGQAHVALGDIETAQMLVDKVPQEHQEKEPLAALIKTIALARQGENLGDIAALAQAVEQEPKNHQARLDYAIALNAQGERTQAAEQLIEIVRVDRKWNDDGARAKLLEFFEAWGNTDPATLAGRRALSSVLFS